MQVLQPNIQKTTRKRLIGISAEMSLVKDGTQKLWQEFMPKRGSILNRIGSDFLSLQIFPSDYFKTFDPTIKFKKWACVEVEIQATIPEEMYCLELPKGLYAVFNHVGPSSDKSIFQTIYSEWLPNSKYKLDDRPHFEVLGEKYSNNSEYSEEDIWIPIREKVDLTNI